MTKENVCQEKGKQIALKSDLIRVSKNILLRKKAIVVHIVLSVPDTQKQVTKHVSDGRSSTTVSGSIPAKLCDIIHANRILLAYLPIFGNSFMLVMRYDNYQTCM